MAPPSTNNPNANNATVPDFKNIPHAHRLPVTHRDVVRTFSRLSRQSLIALAQQWLTKKNRDFCRPYLRGDSLDGDDAAANNQEFEPASSYEELQEIYKGMATRKSAGGRKEVMDRILEGDWRTGISMFQLATAEIQHLLDHPTTLRWTAKRLARVPTNKVLRDEMEITNESDHLPRFPAQTFMMNLARELTPLLKAHYLLMRMRTLPITIMRVYIVDSPYSSEAALAAEPKGTDTARSVFFIWPNGSPFVFLSIATHTGQTVGDQSRHLRDFVLEAIPKAFSRPSARYQLVNTNFSTKSLSALLEYRGPGNSNAAGGGWSIFADHSFSQNALDFVATARAENLHKKKDRDDEGEGATGAKRGPGRPRKEDTAEFVKRRRIAEGRFGSSGKQDDGKGIEKFDVRIDDPFPVESTDGTAQNGRNGKTQAAKAPDDAAAMEAETWVPDVRISFKGPHVFAGVRELVEQGIIDGEKMPGWMTGEAGVTIGTVKNGRIRMKGAVPGV